MGCHFLLQCMKVKSESEVAQLCLTQRLHGLQPTRLLCPRDFPGKSIGVECQLCLTLCKPRPVARQASLSFALSQSLLRLMSIESVMASTHLILCCPLLLLPSILPSIRVFPSESALCIRLKYWSFSFASSSFLPMNIQVDFL